MELFCMADDLASLILIFSFYVMRLKDTLKPVIKRPYHYVFALLTAEIMPS